jgi:IS5 family transposase
MKAHVGVDAESSLVHSVIGTAANVADVTQAHELLHGHETVAFGDAGYIGVERRAEQQTAGRMVYCDATGKRRRCAIRQRVGCATVSSVSRRMSGPVASTPSG